MQITRETDYAIRCVLHLSLDSERTYMVEEIAEARGVPRSFLAKILQKLKRAGIVMSFRGVKGGFKLSKPSAEITILDVVDVMQGGVTVNICVQDDELCKYSGECAAHEVWMDVRDIVESKLKVHDFESLAKRQKEIYRTVGKKGVMGPG